MRLPIFGAGLLVLSATLVATPASAAPSTPLRVHTFPLGTPTESTRTLRLHREHTPTFSAYDVTWRRGDGEVAVTGRVRQHGRWTAWQQLDVDGESAKPTGRQGPSLVWTGPSDGIELKVSGPAADTRLELIDPGSQPADAEAAQVTESAGRPRIYTRADWGADERQMTWHPEYADAVHAIVLHHTATSNDYRPEDVPRIIRSIYHYQAVSLGWGDIGYNVMLDRYGRLWEGRAGGVGKPVVGAHAGGFNTGTAGIGMIGIYTETKVPDQVIHTAAGYVAWKFGMYGIDPRGSTRITGGPNTKYDHRVTITVPRVYPHNQTSATECPGRYGMAALQPIRDQAHRYGHLYGQ